jgi:hypothetical protein
LLRQPRRVIRSRILPSHRNCVSVGGMKKKHRSRQTTRGGRLFLEALADGRTVSHAAEIAGISETTLRKRREEDPAFAAEWDLHFQMGTGTLEDEALRRGMGWRKPVIYRGFQVRDNFGDPVFLHKCSDALLIFLSEARDPHRYCEKVIVAAIRRQWDKEDREAETKSFEADPTIVELLRKFAAAKAATAVHIAPTPAEPLVEPEPSLN